jgi:hypothetical protein
VAGAAAIEACRTYGDGYLFDNRRHADLSRQSSLSRHA